MKDTLVLGAVAYDPKVVTIWDGFAAFFKSEGLAFDYVLYENYERQVEAHLRGHFDIAWNSPLAFLEAREIGQRVGRSAKALAMRDTDCDLTSLVVVRAHETVQAVSDLKGKRVGVGALDSPQATLIPLVHLAKCGLARRGDFEVVRHDVLLGKHGDHIGGERDAVRALLRGEVDAACIIDSNLALFTQEGTAPPGSLRVLTQTEPYDHCNFTVFQEDERTARFVELLLAMQYDDPKVRRLLDLEGLKAWKIGRTTGYADLEKAMHQFGAVDAYIDRVARTLGGA